MGGDREWGKKVVSQKVSKRSKCLCSISIPGAFEYGDTEVELVRKLKTTADRILMLAFGIQH